MRKNKYLKIVISFFRWTKKIKKKNKNHLSNLFKYIYIYIYIIIKYKIFWKIDCKSNLLVLKNYNIIELNNYLCFEGQLPFLYTYIYYELNP
jgi:hypothetical protein